MQFKEQGGKVQVLLYTGFDEARNAPIVRIVGSFDKYTYKPSPGLLDKLSIEQRDELDAECNRRRQAALALNRQHYINSLAANIRGACDSLDNNAALTPQQSDEIWDAMAELVRAMREAGYPRPSRDRKPGAEAGQGSLFE
ncbi:hypothetical protein [Noviherbaspirillum soli]|uniref:hypothetical protein n=1 Tax=Noviherbaspirillum soli TaxID=1064518 RepID=UPI00188A6EEA|nr:hypothetical protein [Noviherbaspirillum soli]